MLKDSMRVLESLLNKGFLILLVLFLGLFLESSTKESVKYVYIPNDYSYKIGSDNLLDSIYKEIIALKISYPEIVMSQIILETGYLTSNLFANNNNLFGMRTSGSRATTSTIIVNGYKWYPHWRDSLLDYALLQMAFYRGKSEEEYYNKLNRVYAEDPHYTDKLKFIRNKLMDNNS